MIDEIKSQLLEAFLMKDNAEGALKNANERIAALRNVLAGFQAAEKAADKETPPSAP